MARRRKKDNKLIYIFLGLILFFYFYQNQNQQREESRLVDVRWMQQDYPVTYGDKTIMVVNVDSGETACGLECNGELQWVDKGTREWFDGDPPDWPCDLYIGVIDVDKGNCPNYDCAMCKVAVPAECSGAKRCCTDEKDTCGDCCGGTCLNDNQYLIACHCDEGRGQYRMSYRTYDCFEFECDKSDIQERYVGSCGPQCTDSDGGDVPYTKGTVTVGSNSFTDYCNGPNQLTEYYCSGDSLATNTYTGVSCSDGALQGGNECTDTDGGKNYYTKGTVTNFEGTATDWCVGDRTLVEMYCSTLVGNYGTRLQQTYDCEPGYNCRDGACVTCTADCAGKECGGDGCGRTCGTCGADEICVSGVCEPACSDTCSSLGYECGFYDVCGASTNCGSCSSGEQCIDGVCRATCSLCPNGYECVDNQCVLWIYQEDADNFVFGTNGDGEPTRYYGYMIAEYNKISPYVVKAKSKLKHATYDAYDTILPDACSDQDPIQVKGQSNGYYAVEGGSWFFCWNGNGWTQFGNTPSLSTGRAYTGGGGQANLNDGKWDTYAWYDYGSGWSPSNHDPAEIYEEALYFGISDASGCVRGESLQDCDGMVEHTEMTSYLRRWLLEEVGNSDVYEVIKNYLSS